jgi:hypothetical protein
MLFQQQTLHSISVVRDHHERRVVTDLEGGDHVVLDGSLSIRWRETEINYENLLGQIRTRCLLCSVIDVLTCYCLFV